MAKILKQIHDLVDLAFDQGLTHHWSRAQIDVAVHNAQMGLFRELLREHPRTLRTRNLLLPFQKSAVITLTAGIGDVPADFEHEIEFFVNDSGKRHIPVIERGYWDNRRRDPIDVPTTAKPICTVYGDAAGVAKVEVYPTSLANIGVLQFIEPRQPSYKTSTNGSGQIVYDDTTTVDVLWSSTVHDILAERALKILGIAINDVQALQVAMQKEGQDPKL